MAKQFKFYSSSLPTYYTSKIISIPSEYKTNKTEFLKERLKVYTKVFSYKLLYFSSSIHFTYSASTDKDIIKTLQFPLKVQERIAKSNRITKEMKDKLKKLFDQHSQKSSIDAVLRSNHKISLLLSTIPLVEFNLSRHESWWSYNGGFYVK